MQHCDPDMLALVALGEQAPAGDAEHLLACEQCRSDVEELRQVVSAVRVDVTAGAPLAPPARVWDGIAAATGVGTPPRADHVRGASSSAPTAGRRRPADELAARRRPGRGIGAGIRARALVGVAAAALVVGAAGGVLGTRLAERPGPAASPTQQVIAEVPLDNLKPAVTRASGSAAVVRTASGPRLQVDVSQLAPMRGHFYEVWLIDSNIKKMVSLGILDGSTGEFVIPNGVDVSAYPIIDISVQQPGNPKHSGDSVLRGTIPA